MDWKTSKDDRDCYDMFVKHCPQQYHDSQLHCLQVLRQMLQSFHLELLGQAMPSWKVCESNLRGESRLG